ncbi:50S ribosome-binding GTPase [Arthrobacter sp. EH-1B-1]|uniref:50S ribosome-binding GTPase n=1 Tax=Arthrobacter vasquezii TaxID=2977629 RepID=A0ABT6CVQ1_9MICC|nr:GTPase [Arthrobacter vasquezii]MDF9277970.1 50S ribosome-binding GTPase [Arthrobacter vasquezii]
MSRHRGEGSSSRLQVRLESLNAARELAEGRVDEDQLGAVYEVLDRASSRRSLSSAHTVVGIFGPTGSGKSSLLNALTGTDLARVAARRPTTAEPLAVIWNEDGTEDLLDWLQVPNRHVMPDGAQLLAVSGDRRRGSSDGGVDGGLILLDLPDFDSTELGHRVIVERLAGQVDVLLWITDPQKYADAALHREFLEPLATHESVILVALNQSDRLSESDLTQVTGSLKQILAAEGHGSAVVHTVSALTGTGLGGLAEEIRTIVRRKEAATGRLSADVDVAVESLQKFSGPELPPPSKAARAALSDRLAGATGADAVIDAVVRSYRRDAHAVTGWPVTRWLGRLRSDPLRRLNLRRGDVQDFVGRTSLPEPGPAQRASVDRALRTFGDELSAGAVEPWRTAIRDAAKSPEPELLEHLDEAVARTDFASGSRAWWWPVAGVLQWFFLAAMVVGIGWLALLAALAFLQFPVPESPTVEGIPVPTLLAVGGVAAGIAIGILCAGLARLGARRRGKRVRRRLVASISETTETVAVGPAAAEIERYNGFVRAVAAAGSRR